ncbi:peptidylprolyl isomerase [Nitratidesulfovibrio sp. SRB-5]|uniref:peptidylprolyl isomerase n=1 Tax=Nitratidesulfovibrio sp. SRB-5 TaxID=2872636 RepID=UPI001025B073|nr:peptidylprolyl isomerase [Nitratidesulfovibrio sp. SRB-5]MBZ2171670.1 peptidylprolyl isomerase [Nitratidesulfovibrio sp. SRB-5]RXF75769.1 peptidyl-prolyl cis-trans isomerase [Desulfovibrio sp. DS-1]
MPSRFRAGCRPFGGARAILPLCAVLLVLLLSGCGQDPLPEGVVATVNERPIMLRTLEAVHDMNSMSWSGHAPSVEQLQAQYGAVLSDLIVQELVAQALERENIAVSDAEVAEAEAEVRGDYPAGEFEKSLVEEYIDLDLWRSRLRARIAMQKFMRLILRPTISIPLEEVETYYAAHRQDYRLPRRVQFLVVAGPDKAAVDKARALSLGGAKPADVEAAQPSVTVREVKMRRDRLPALWSKELAGLAPRQASAVKQGEWGYQSFLLVGEIAEKQLELSHAYPLVERVLLERKMDEAYARWMEAELRTARIRVSAHLLPEARGAAKGAAAQGANATGMPGVPGMSGASGTQGQSGQDLSGQGAQGAQAMQPQEILDEGDPMDGTAPGSELDAPPPAEDGKGTRSAPANGAQRKTKAK